MEDKMFELMTKMYTEMQEMKENMATKADLNDIKEELKQDIAKLEDNHGRKLDALADGYTQCIEGINKLQNEVEKLTDRVEHQEIKLQVIKGF